MYVHNDLLGDGLLKLPAIAALRPAFPGHHITWLSGLGNSVFSDQLAPLIEGMVDVVEDKITVGKYWGELINNPLRGHYYDVIIDTQNVVRCSMVLKRIPHRLFVSPAVKFLLSDRKPDKQTGFSGSMRNRLLTLIRIASGSRVNSTFRATPPQRYRELAGRLLPAGPKYVGIAPGAGDKRKCWPLERFIEVGRHQTAKGRVPVYFMGPEELAWVAQVRTAVPGALLPEQEDVPHDLRGPLLTMSLAQRTAIGVANDSGAGHVMAVSGAPLISLFGHTSTEKFVDDPENRTIIHAQKFGAADISLIPLATVLDAVDNYFKADN